MKSIVICTIAILSIVSGWAVWKLRPFTRSGQTVRVGNWIFDDYEMQVWQLKKATISEPFSTSLYVRRQTNAWFQYYLNHQDLYAPRYALVRTNEMVVVYRDRKMLGTFYLSSGEYQRVGGGVGLEDVFWRNPP